MMADANYLSQGLYRCSPIEFAGIMSVSERTLRRWHVSGKLPAGVLPSGRRFYTERHYGACGGDPGEFPDMLARARKGGAGA